MMEAETEVMHLKVKEHQGLSAIPEAKRKAWNGFSSGAFRESRPWLRPDPGLLASRTVRE